MNLIIDHTVIVTDQNGYDAWRKDRMLRPEPIIERRYLRKIYNGVNVIPAKGDAIEDPLWDGIPQTVSIKIYNYDEEYCSITVTPFYVVEGTEWHRNLDNIIRGHGWEILGR